MASQDTSAKKQAFMTRCVNAAAGLQAARVVLSGLAAEWTANGFGSGSSSIGQADISAGNVLHLTPAIIASLMVSQANLETWSGGTGNWTNINAAISS